MDSRPLALTKWKSQELMQVGLEVFGKQGVAGVDQKGSIFRRTPSWGQVGTSRCLSMAFQGSIMFLKTLLEPFCYVLLCAVDGLFRAPLTICCLRLLFLALLESFGPKSLLFSSFWTPGIDPFSVFYPRSSSWLLWKKNKSARKFVFFFFLIFYYLLPQGLTFKPFFGWFSLLKMTKTKKFELFY